MTNYFPTSCAFWLRQRTRFKCSPARHDRGSSHRLHRKRRDHPRGADQCPAYCRRGRASAASSTAQLAAIPSPCGDPSAAVDIDATRFETACSRSVRDVDIRQAFKPYGIKAFDPHPIASGRLTTETGERALLRDALFRALGWRPGLRFERRGRGNLLTLDASAVRPAVFNTARSNPLSTGVRHHRWDGHPSGTKRANSASIIASTTLAAP